MLSRTTNIKNRPGDQESDIKDERRIVGKLNYIENLHRITRLHIMEFLILCDYSSSFSRESIKSKLMIKTQNLC